MPGTLAGKRILIVEDEYFIAADLRRTFREEGAEIVGPVANLKAGLELADERIDAAVLDVNLAETSSFPIADRLESRHIPYMFLTGYDGWSLPPDYQHVVRLGKPFAIRSVVEMVAKLVDPEREEA